MNNFDRCEKEYLEEPEGENEYKNECAEYGKPSEELFCSGECWGIAKADYDMDQEKDGE